jgi:DNA-binding NarL/FixJ family response regulator
MKNKLKVLIVDQSPMDISRIKKLLIGMADEIIISEAGNYFDASQLLKLVLPDVVLLDLPQGDGINLVTEIKAGYPSVKVIVFTNYTERFFLGACIQKGADYFIEKSTEFNMIHIILYEMIIDDLYEIM